MQDKDKFKVTFLAAADGTALTKQYTSEDGDHKTTRPYPNVRDFNSFEYEIDSLQDWLTYIIAHSDEGHCYLKGNLDKKLENESRAGHTNPSLKTRTVLLDLDFNEGFRDVEDFLEQLDPMFKDVSYILQHSNSAGITGKKGLRVHLGFLLKKPVAPERLKLWLQYKNLTLPGLRDLLHLTANGMSLKYPLDITTCQNDKVIYIARPECVGFEDPLADERTILVEKANEQILGEIELINPQVVQQLVEKKVASLRAAKGLDRKTCRMSKRGAPVLLNPDKAVVTSVRPGPVWTYVNLNDGDSWGYFHSTTNPDILKNFKGEPEVHLRDIAPEYLATLNKSSGHQEPIPMVFRDRKRDQYYNLIYDPNIKEIDSLDCVNGEKKMYHFMAQYNRPLPDPIEDWDIEFDPRTIEVYKPQNKWVNSFKPSVYMKTDYDPIPRIPYVINRIITSICVDEEYKEWFVNWVAYLYQYRVKSGICPIFHGTQGTGKGLFQEKVLQPLFGFEHTPKLTTQQVQDQFNGWTEKCILAVWDEAEQNDAFNNGVYDKVKNLITEETLMLRLMRQNPIKLKSYLNLMVFTNHPYPFPLEAGDRRFSPAPPQLEKLIIGLGEVEAIEDELDMFAAYLQNYKVNTMKARSLCDNQARLDMISGSANTVDTFFNALHEGNLDYFLDFQRDNALTTPDPLYNDYERVLRRWANDLGSKKATIVTREEARAVYSHIIKKFDSPGKFKKMGAKYHFKAGKAYIDGKQERGWAVTWSIKDQDVLDDFLKPDIARLKLA